MAQKSHHPIYGMASGVIMSGLLQPLEILKTNMMVTAQRKGLFKVLGEVWTQEGLKGFYRGVSAAMVKTGLASAIYFSSMQSLRSRLEKRKGNKDLVNFVSSAVARIGSGVVTNPLSVVRTRQEMLGFQGYSGVLQGVRDVYLKEGVRGGLFKGGLTTSLINGPFAGIYFLFFIKFKEGLCQDNSLTAGLAAGAVATLLTNPLDLVRARLQTQGHGQHSYHYKGILDASSHILKEEGLLAGCLKGIQPRIIKKPISNTLCMMLYEVIFWTFEKGHAF